MMLVKKDKNGCRREMRQLGVIRTKNNNARRNKRLQIRRLSAKNKETVMSLSLSLSLTSSSSSSSSSENYDVLEKKARTNTVTCLSHGTMSVIGRRKEMEDAVRVELGFMGGGGGDGDGDGDDDDDQKKYDFFGVYDGHGGARVAEACKERMHEVLVEVIAGEDYGEKNIEWERVMEGCFGKMDEEVNRGTVREEMVGSTAVVAVVGKEELVVANCGDSRAVLSRGGVVVPLSVDHKPDRHDELIRVEAAGGRVINWNGPRILGVLATSRSIGDQYLKPFVISKPDVTVTERSDRDEFLILASDGLWDVVSNEAACQVVRRCFSGRIKWASSVDAGNQNPAARAAAVLVELAISRGSSDNISVIVVELNKPTKFNS